MSVPTKYIGLDLECTGSNHRLHKMIQIGVATLVGKPDYFVSDIRQELYRYEEEALKVCQFTHERIAAGAPLSVVEEQLLGWLAERVPEPKRLVTVGWNVGAFDLQFVGNESPAIMERLHYRHVDLNSLVFTLGATLGRDSMKIKKEAKTWAAAQFVLDFPEIDLTWHDAGYDAMCSIYAWKYLMDYMKSDKFTYAILRQRVMGDALAPEM